MNSQVALEWLALSRMSLPWQVYSRVREEGLTAAEIWRGKCPPRFASELSKVRAECFAWAAGQKRECAAAGVELLYPGHASYPKSLGLIAAPPLVLYLKGDTAAVGCHMAAVVGSRDAVSYGERVTREITERLVAAGYTVVSGGARGIDAAVHEEALNRNGRTVAVLGTGVDVDYPKVNSALFQRILDQGGALITEYPLGTLAARWNFPRRNRLISGLCEKVIVTQAAARSGALITANAAAEQGREVWAVTARVGEPEFAGCLRLISDGAHPVISPAEVVDAGAGVPRPRRDHWLEQYPPTERKVLSLIMDEEKDLDELAVDSGVSIDTLTSLISRWEADGIVQGRPFYGFRVNHDNIARETAHAV